VAVQDRNSSEYLGPAIKLYDWLIRPIEPELERLHPDTLVFVSTGSLRGVPLGALRDALDGTFLVEKYALAIAPGLTLTAPRPLGAGPTPALKAGLSESVQGYPALASVPRELASVDALFPGPTLLNERFVESQLEQTLGGSAFGIVHIASHAEFHGGIDDAFIVTFDGKLGMKRLAQLVGMTEFRDQPLELLALSACQTAAGDERAALGLAGVAVKAGARSTLASLWYIEDEASGKLMAEFYAGLAKPGVTRAAALQRAQLALLSDPKFRHPVTWAPFLLIGSWQ
jgi:CHAT domain-containing protein